MNVVTNNHNELKWHLVAKNGVQLNKYSPKLPGKVSLNHRCTAEPPNTAIVACLESTPLPAYAGWREPTGVSQ